MPQKKVSPPGFEPGTLRYTDFHYSLTQLGCQWTFVWCRSERKLTSSNLSTVRIWPLGRCRRGTYWANWFLLARLLLQIASCAYGECPLFKQQRSFEAIIKSTARLNYIDYRYLPKIPRDYRSSPCAFSFPSLRSSFRSTCRAQDYVSDCICMLRLLKEHSLYLKLYGVSNLYCDTDSLRTVPCCLTVVLSDRHMVSVLVSTRYVQHTINASVSSMTVTRTLPIEVNLRGMLLLTTGQRIPV